ncbi:hypothetical protein T05_4523 [Trichinella murrelli]|uniref:Uncharacterized protein n=1 Tax=Trichinella murrelli TaxID=144512 RepID=A0A0V0UGV4_9BILA|nr:hypothetical protein T05_4523 [Trichinella murrelli]
MQRWKLAIFTKDQICKIGKATFVTIHLGNPGVVQFSVLGELFVFQVRLKISHCKYGHQILACPLTST